MYRWPPEPMIMFLSRRKGPLTWRQVAALLAAAWAGPPRAPPAVTARTEAARRTALMSRPASFIVSSREPRGGPVPGQTAITPNIFAAQAPRIRRIRGGLGEASPGAAPGSPGYPGYPETRLRVVLLEPLHDRVAGAFVQSAVRAGPVGSDHGRVGQVSGRGQHARGQCPRGQAHALEGQVAQESRYALRRIRPAGAGGRVVRPLGICHRHLPARAVD